MIMSIEGQPRLTPAADANPSSRNNAIIGYRLRHPSRCKTGADKNMNWVVTKRIDASAHLDAEAADLMVAGGVKQSSQTNKAPARRHLRPSDSKQLISNGPRFGNRKIARRRGASRTKAASRM